MKNRTLLVLCLAGLSIFWLGYKAAWNYRYHILRSWTLHKSKPPDIALNSSRMHALKFEYLGLLTAPNGDYSMNPTISPYQRYRKIVRDAFGNCSNISWGNAELLSVMGKRFNLVHLFYKENLHTGLGHTILELLIEYPDGTIKPTLVDPLGGLLLSLENGEPASLNNIDTNLSVSFSPYVTNAPDTAEYFNREDFDGFGVLNSREILNYFYNHAKIYLPLPFLSDLHQKLLYDLIAIILGYYPTVYTKNYQQLVGSNGNLYKLLQMSLYFVRFFLVLFFCLTLFYSIRLLIQRVRAKLRPYSPHLRRNKEHKLPKPD